MSNMTVTASTAPGALGPYSQAVVAGDWVFTAGQIGLDASDETLKETIEGQTLQVLENLTAVLAAAGGGWRDVVKTTVYLWRRPAGVGGMSSKRPCTLPIWPTLKPSTRSTPKS